MPTASTAVSTEIAVPPATAWAVVSEHEGTPGWVPKAKRVTLLVPGTPRNGLGAVRRAEFRPAMWSTIDEEVVRWDEGERFDYAITSGMPGLRSHLGSMRVVPTAAGCRVSWEVQFDFQWWWGPFLRSFVRAFEGAQQEGMDTLKAQLEAQ